jgi:DNA-binding transcriptional ArsR family regulator
MQHLEVLVDAGLVMVQREGRQRWNHLNPLPIKHIYDRWIGEYVTFAVDLLARLKSELEGDSKNLVSELAAAGDSTADT